jgi:23S rRNA (guanosine2251-2'-O)-methyltransferase
LLLILDAIQDPHNFGAILRSADAMGMSGVFVGKTGQAEVTSLVARSSAGAVNHISLAQVDDLAGLAELLQSRGVQILGASEKEGIPADQCDFRRPTALVIGNEGIGIRPELLRLCDARVTIPQHGHVGSLNAAVSAGILLYEARRQRGPVGNQKQRIDRNIFHESATENPHVLALETRPEMVVSASAREAAATRGHGTATPDRLA